MITSFWFIYFQLQSFSELEIYRERTPRASQLKSIIRVLVFSLRTLSFNSAFSSLNQNKKSLNDLISNTFYSACRIIYFCISEIVYKIELDDSEISEIFDVLFLNYKLIENNGQAKVSLAKTLFHLCKNLYITNSYENWAILEQIISFIVKNITDYTSSEDRKYLIKALNYTFQCFKRYEAQLCDFVQNTLDKEGLLKSNDSISSY